jgi:hypothetical protein
MLERPAFESPINIMSIIVINLYIKIYIYNNLFCLNNQLDLYLFLIDIKHIIKYKNYIYKLNIRIIDNSTIPTLKYNNLTTIKVYNR